MHPNPYSALAPVIRARVRRRLAGSLPAADLEDVTQEVWVRLLDGRLSRFDPARGPSLFSYVGLIAEREAGKQLAARSTLKRGADLVRVDSLEEAAEEHPLPPPDGALEDRELLRLLLAHLDEHLSEKGWVVLRALHGDGQTAEEAAQTLSVSTQVVYNWQHKIRALARAFRPSPRSSSQPAQQAQQAPQAHPASPRACGR